MSPGRILIVDDDPDHRTIASTILEHHGYEVEATASGAHALERLTASRFDVVLLDLYMPKPDGFDLLTALQSSGEPRPIPCIVVTAHALPDDHERAMALGCTLFHTKPIRPLRLLADVERLIAGCGDPPG